MAQLKRWFYIILHSSPEKDRFVFIYVFLYYILILKLILFDFISHLFEFYNLGLKISS